MDDHNRTIMRPAGSPSFEPICRLADHRLPIEQAVAEIDLRALGECERQRPGEKCCEAEMRDARRGMDNPR